MGPISKVATVYQKRNEDVSAHFTNFKRMQLQSQASNHKGLLKSIWHKASGLNARAYKIQFGIMGAKVTYDAYDSYPLCLMGEKFRPERKPAAGQSYPSQDKKEFKEKIKYSYFKSLIWSSYRKGFEKELLHEERS